MCPEMLDKCMTEQQLDHEDHPKYQQLHSCRCLADTISEMIKILMMTTKVCNHNVVHYAHLNA